MGTAAAAVVRIREQLRRGYNYDSTSIRRVFVRLLTKGH